MQWQRRSLGSVFALLALLVVTPAAAGPLDRWDKVTSQRQAGTDQIGLHRTGDGALHVTWKRSSGALSDDLFHTSISGGGMLGSATPIVTGWTTLEGSALVPEPGGGIRVFFGGIRSTDPSETLFGLNTATGPASGNPWSLSPASLYTGEFAYGRTPAAAVAGDGTPFQAWYSTAQTVVHRGLSLTPAFPFGPGDSTDIRQNLASDTSSGRMFVAWCSFGGASQGVWLQEVNTASGAPAGPAQRLPGSTTTFEGAEHSTCNLEKAGGVSDRMPFVARPGGGLYVAGTAGYPSPNRLLLWRFGSDGSLQETVPLVSSSSFVGTIALAATPDGRVVVAWTERGATMRLRGSNDLGTEFGPTVTLRFPAGSADISRVDLAAQTRVVDVLARFTSAGNVIDLWHTQVETPPAPFPAVIPPSTPTVPPARPRGAARTYGVIDRAYITLLAGGKPVTRVGRAPGFRAHFVFRTRPRGDAFVKATWYYNNGLVGEVPLQNASRLRSFARSRGGLPRGYFRCVLQVRLPRGAWRAITDARARVG